MYTKSPIDVILNFRRDSIPLNNLLPTPPAKEEIKYSIKLVVEEAINDLNDWLSRGNTPDKGGSIDSIKGIIRETTLEERTNNSLSGIFLNKLKTSFRYNGGTSLYPYLDLKDLKTSIIKSNWDKKACKYSIDIFHSNRGYHYPMYSDAFKFMSEVGVMLKQMGDLMKYKHHILKSFSPVYFAIEKISK